MLNTPLLISKTTIVGAIVCIALVAITIAVCFYLSSNSDKKE